MDSFLAEAVKVSGRPLVPGAPELVDQLEQAALFPLPAVLRDFLERASGFGSAIYDSSVAERVYFGGTEFYEVHELIAIQSRLVRHGVLAEKLNSRFVVAGGITGPGSAIVLAGEDSDPPVLHIQGSNDFPLLGSGSLVGESFSSYVDGLILSDHFVRESRSMPVRTLLAFDLAGSLAKGDVASVLGEFDSILSLLCNHRLHSDHSPPNLGLRNVVDVDHQWIQFAQVEGPKMLEVSSNSVSTFTDGLVLVCLGLSLLRCVGGTFVDNAGLFFEAGSSISSVDDVVSALADVGVDGDLDDLVVSFRRVLESRSHGN